MLRDVSLRLRRGEVAALLGPNGAGKTTCFYAIAGLVPPDRGTIMVDGRDVTWLPMYRRAKLGIGYLPQEASIFRGMTVADNIRAILEISVPTRRSATRCSTSCSASSRSPTCAAPRRSRSRAASGAASRSPAASPPSRTTCCSTSRSPASTRWPSPTSAASSRHLKDRGLGVLITDHNVRETLDIVDRAYILHEGSVLMTGTPEEVVRDDNVRRVYLGDSFRI